MKKVGIERVLVRREFFRKRANGLDNNCLELIANIRHKASNLFHQTFHTVLAFDLQESGDCEGRNGAIDIIDEILKFVRHSTTNRIRVHSADFIQGLAGSKTESGLRGVEK